MKKPSKPKKLAYRLIEPFTEPGLTLYELLRGLIAAHHDELLEARIALAWNLTWNPDVDGRVILGKCKRASDLDRELAAYDFVIMLRQAFFEDTAVTDLQRRALIDHELMHAAVKYDGTGEPVIDEKGRTVYRMRKHDLEEFSAIAERYGCWKKDIEQFAAAIDEARYRGRAWVGYSRLQELLAQAGAGIPLEMIRAWSETERREAQIWAQLAVRTVDQALAPARPGHITTAIGSALTLPLAPAEPPILQNTEEAR